VRSLFTPLALAVLVAGPLGAQAKPPTKAAPKPGAAAQAPAKADIHHRAMPAGQAAGRAAGTDTQHRAIPATPATPATPAAHPQTVPPAKPAAGAAGPRTGKADSGVKRKGAKKKKEKHRESSQGPAGHQ
jgi:hypothetical protein